MDAPEISRSAGASGGVVVFWPRVSPRSDDPAVRDVAARVQQRLREVVARALPGRAVDVRPEPERVCPRAGCAAMTVGAVLTHRDGSCAVLALVSGPGTASARIVPWGGGVRLRQDTVAFREPPEPMVTVTDFAACAALADAMGAHDADVEAALRAAAP